MTNITIICPVYNEEKNLTLFSKKILQVCKKIKNSKILFINDGSIDNSLNLIKQISKKNKKIKYLSFNKNYGHQSAILAGLEKIESDYYVAIDTDLQHDPIHLIKMIKIIKNSEFDLVQMKKNHYNYENFIKTYLSKKFYNLFRNLVKIDIADGSSDFYVINKELRNKVIQSKFGNNFLRGLIHWLSLKKKYINYSPDKRNAGTSKYSFIKQILFGLTGILNFFGQFYFVLFKFAIFSSLIGMFYIIYIIFDFFKNGISVDGWNTIIILILIFGILNILNSTVQIYLINRIYNFIGKKPDYIISETNFR